MNSTKKRHTLPLLLTLILDMALIISVFFLMNHVQKLLDSDAKINLTEIVTQNKDVISSKIKLELNNLQLIAQQLSDEFLRAPDDSYETRKNLFLEYSSNKGDGQIVWSDAEGQAVQAGGQTVDIAGRKYFQLSMEGTSNISERMISRVSGEDIFVLCVPLKANGSIIGTIQKQYTPTEMYDLCTVSLFSEQGAVYIINREGYILITSKQDEYTKESDNYYRYLYTSNPEASQRLQADIQNNKAGFMETDLNGVKQFSAYTPVDDVYDWYLISSVATNAVSPNATFVIKLFYCILVAVALFFAFIMLYYLSYRNRQQANLERLAFVDPVTQGNTYTKFILDLDEQLSDRKPEQNFALLSFDIENFKYINSCYGFEKGDRILRSIYELYASKITNRELIARVSGDQFVLMLEDASEERLKTLFEPEYNDGEIKVYLFAGLYNISNFSESVNLMVDKASTAAQKIKGFRHHPIGVYSKQFDLEIAHNEEMKRAIEQALANGEIIPYFQPKVNIYNHKLTGAEALARWQKPDGTLVAPNDFIPICEKTGLIVVLDMTIFEKTLQFLRQNLDLGVPCLPISVNFSRMHLLNPNFLQTLMNKINEYKIPPELIEVELTETVIFDNYSSMEELINQLHENNVQISMDDFGSGYSSLHMLKDVAIDVLKIDRGFLRDTEHSDRQRIIVGTIIQMAQQLNIRVVVEGVESEQHLALMREFGCSVAQGYYFSKPISQEKFEVLYREGSIC